MRSVFRAIVVAGAVAGALPAGLVAQTSLTIYSDGRVLERRVVPGPVPAGASVREVGLGLIDLGSLFALDSGVTVMGASTGGPVDELTALRRAAGRTLTFLTRTAAGGRDSVVAVVLGVDPERFRLPDGRVTFSRPGVPLFPADLVPDRPLVTLALTSNHARPGLGLGFFRSGASWRAAYAITLGRNEARVAGHAVIQAGPLQADSAEVQLLAGNVGRAAKMMADTRISFQVARPAMAMEAASEEQVGEAHLYTVPGRVSLEPGQETTVALFEPVRAPVDRRYVVRGQLPYRGPLPQVGDEADVPVFVSYTVTRRTGSGFGDLPIPGGMVRLYQADAAGRPQLIGEASIGHTAPGQDLRLDAGTAFDLTATRVQTAYTTRRDSLRTRALASYRVTLSNAKDSAVTVDVLEQRYGEWSVLDSSVQAERVSTTTTRFRVRVPAKGEATLTYRVRVIW